MWKLRDVVVAVILALVCGLIFRLWDGVYTILNIGWVPGQALINGVWFLAGMLIPYVVRRPGAAIIAELIASMLELVLAGNWGWGSVLSGLLQGFGAEIGFMVFAWKRYDAWAMMLAGVLSALGFFPQWLIGYQGLSYPAGQIFGYGIFNLISGAVLGGLLAKWIGDALYRTGVLRNFEIGKQRRAGQV